MYIQQYGQLENHHWWFTVRQKIILQSLKKFIPAHQLSQLKILNVGAAAGGSSKWLSILGETVSLENDPLFVNYLTDQHIAVINASVTDIPLDDGSFNLVCAFDVVEHVEDDRKAIDELLRVCEPGGTLCITVPAFQILWGNHDVVNGHKRRYRKEQLNAMINIQESAVLYCTYFNMLLFLPILLLRKIQLLRGNKTVQNDSDFSYFKRNIFLNKIFKIVFGIELFLLRAIKFPFGVSLIMLIRKNTAPQEKS